MQLSMAAKGNDAPGGGVAGDLLILIEEQEDPNLKRDGNNLIYDLYISFPDAALGTSVEVPSVGGRVKIKIEPGTQSGKVLRLRGKGLKDINGYETGDQLIYVNSAGYFLLVVPGIIFHVLCVVGAAFGSAGTDRFRVTA